MTQFETQIQELTAAVQQKDGPKIRQKVRETKDLAKSIHDNIAVIKEKCLPESRE